MSLPARMMTVLTAVSFLSASLLVGVNILTVDRIAANKQREIEAAITHVVPGTTASSKLYEEKGFAVYNGRDADGRLAGYAIQAAAGGFQDVILLLVGTDPEVSRIRRLVVLEQKETPGLGAKIVEEGAFLRFWKDRDCRVPLTLRKPPVAEEELMPTEVNAVTGATISSEAVLAGVNGALARFRLLRQEGKIPAEDQNAR